MWFMFRSVAEWWVQAELGLMYSLGVIWQSEEHFVLYGQNMNQMWLVRKGFVKSKVLISEEKWTEITIKRKWS